MSSDDTVAAKELAYNFLEYCLLHPEERFWQALRNWSGQNFIYASNASEYLVDIPHLRDTFYWKGKHD